MPEYLTPGVYFELRDRAPEVRGLRTDIAGFVGLAERGPVGRPVRIESLRQFLARFGAFVAHAFLAYAVKGFFENGGRTCFVVRVAGAATAPAARRLRSPTGVDIAEMTAVDEGSWGNAISLTVSLVRSRERAFSLVVTRGRLERESFPDLSLMPDHPRYFERLINQGDDRHAASTWIRAQDLIPVGTARTTALLPEAMASGTAFLTGGRDGLASLTTHDFLGDLDPLLRDEDKKGLSALERVDEVSIVAIPDIHIRPVALPPKSPAPEPARDPCRPCPAPRLSVPAFEPALDEQVPLFSPGEVEDAQRALIEHCERMKDRVAILDAALEAGGQTRSLASLRDWRSRFDSERGFAALYYPWVGVVDPLEVDGRPVRFIPPSGHVAGLYARFDQEVGVHRAPANGELFWAQDLAREVDEGEQGVLNPEGVNCLRPFPGRGIRVYGARTISSNPDWRFVNVRRLLLMIEEAVDEATQWAVFEPHDFTLRQTLVLAVSGLLEALWRKGALVGAKASEAFYVKCDDTNNPPASVDEGRVVVEVGAAPTIPAEFVIFRIGRTLQELELVER